MTVIPDQCLGLKWFVEIVQLLKKTGRIPTRDSSVRFLCPLRCLCVLAQNTVLGISPELPKLPIIPSFPWSDGYTQQSTTCLPRTFRTQSVLPPGLRPATFPDLVMGQALS